MPIKNAKVLTWVEIDLATLRHNFRVLRTLAVRGRKGKAMGMIAVVKAGAYGHGMIEAAKALVKAGTEFLGVSNVKEGMTLRQHGIKKPILLFENPLPEIATDIVKYRLTPMVCTLELARALNVAAKKFRRVIDIHLKIDTGMGRLGVWHQEADEFARTVNTLANLRITGVATHFPSADCDAAFTRRQIKIFESLIHRLSFIIPHKFHVHACNSAGVSCFHSSIFTLVRPGLMLYGLYPNEAIRRRIRLRPVMSVKSRIIFIKKIQPGCSVSYGRTFIARRPMTVATLPIGYSDGYFRSLSNKTHVLVGGKFCPQLGRVTMDQIVVDVSKVKNVYLGQEAVILGRQGGQTISAEDLAQWAGTINYEITCNLGNRLPHAYK